MFERQLLTFAALALACVAQEPGKSFEFHGTSLGGQEFDQATFANNVLIVDLWGTWCPPCRKAVPVLVDLYQKYKQHGLEIVGFCFDRGGAAEDVDTVRKFAVENKITYTLAPGDAAIRKQVEGFSGYPTLLMIKDGKVQHTHVGFGDETGASVEEWVRKALGLDGDAPTGDAASGAEEEPKVVVPEGKIYEPGNGDTGFELEALDVSGGQFQFESLRGRPVLLALTSSWDEMAGRTAAFLQRVDAEVEGLEVVAWHLEKVRDQDAKLAAVRTFLTEHGAGYRAVITQLSVSRAKVHSFAAVPTLLLFDRQGVLVQRENGISDEIEKRLQETAARLGKPQDGR